MVDRNSDKWVVELPLKGLNLPLAHLATKYLFTSKLRDRMCKLYFVIRAIDNRTRTAQPAARSRRRPVVERGVFGLSEGLLGGEAGSRLGLLEQDADERRYGEHRDTGQHGVHTNTKRGEAESPPVRA